MIMFIVGHLEEVSTLALQHDCQVKCHLVKNYAV